MCNNKTIMTKQFENSVAKSPIRRFVCACVCWSEFVLLMPGDAHFLMAFALFASKNLFTRRVLIKFPHFAKTRARLPWKTYRIAISLSAVRLKGSEAITCNLSAKVCEVCSWWLVKRIIQVFIIWFLKLLPKIDLVAVGIKDNARSDGQAPATGNAYTCLK